MPIKILVVDDEKDVELLFRQRFRKSVREGNIAFEFAFSGEQALEYLGKIAPPDVTLILSDINMPGMNGFELLEKVKNNYPVLKVMMITAYGDEEHEMKAKELGADGFLTKPLDFKHLEERLLELPGFKG